MKSSSLKYLKIRRHFYRFILILISLYWNLILIESETSCWFFILCLCHFKDHTALHPENSTQCFFYLSALVTLVLAGVYFVFGGKSGDVKWKYDDFEKFFLNLICSMISFHSFNNNAEIFSKKTRIYRPFLFRKIWKCNGGFHCSNSS